MKKLISCIAIFMLCIHCYGQNNALSHKDYDNWKSLKNSKISNDGKIVTYEINPQKGDGKLYIHDYLSKLNIIINKGYNTTITSNSNYVITKIRNPYIKIRELKLKKIKEENFPKDSLYIWYRIKNDIIKISNVIEYISPIKNPEILVYVKHNKIKNHKSNLESKKDLVILNLKTKNKKIFNNIISFSISKNGTLVLVNQEIKSSVKMNQLITYNTKNKNITILNKGKDIVFKNLTIDSKGKQIAYIESTDTLKNHNYKLIFINKLGRTFNIYSNKFNKKYFVSPKGKVFFSENNKRLFFGISNHRNLNHKDSLTEDEKYHLDLWNYKDNFINPYQKKNIKRERDRTYLCVFNINNNKTFQIEDKNTNTCKLYKNGNKKIAILFDSSKYGRFQDFSKPYRDIYTYNLDKGQKIKIFTKSELKIDLSPQQNYMVFFQPQDSLWYAYNINNNRLLALNKNLKTAFYNKKMDMPMSAIPYGLQTWLKNDKYILIADKYDIWKFDCSGKETPINLTKGYGRKNNIKLRYINLSKKDIYPLSKNIILHGFNYKNKKSGYFSINTNKANNPKKLIFSNHLYNENNLYKSKYSRNIIFTKESFKIYPDLYYSDIKFKNVQKISITNPQQNKYKWGNVKLEHWTNGDGVEMEGLLYTPENIDKNKKYPMLVYFYEKSSNTYNKHFVPQPNWSIINRSYCVSNDYIIFVPNITYKNKVGYPGEAAYSSIVTGVLSMCQKYQFIDKKNLGLQGQSWGGYQIAYLVTRTNLFKCAMAGAPVSNMTSAYGGIRWKTGMSRQFQYEQTQSRQGGTLWDSTIQYIENSPLFFVPKIKTPLLIMHNDHDGAVPWYQGIELFMAMRRFNKPCWMLSYNNESHNLRRRANRIDLSIRTMQFFDYYLKNKKEPEWMKYGIPAHKKEYMTGYKLIK